MIKTFIFQFVLSSFILLSSGLLSRAADQFYGGMDSPLDGVMDINDSGQIGTSQTESGYSHAFL